MMKANDLDAARRGFKQFYRIPSAPGFYRHSSSRRCASYAIYKRSGWSQAACEANLRASYSDDAVVAKTSDGDGYITW